jgi:hypothetical protein
LTAIRSAIMQELFVAFPWQKRTHHNVTLYIRCVSCDIYGGGELEVGRPLTRTYYEKAVKRTATWHNKYEKLLNRKVKHELKQDSDR